MAFRFLHMSDVHLDTPFRGIAKAWPDLQKVLQEASFESFRQLIDIAIEESVDFVIVAGDLYDSKDHSMRARLEAARQFARLGREGISVYLAHGNHDPFDPDGVRWPENVKVFPAGRVSRFEVVRQGEVLTEIQGMSYPESAVKDNWVPAFRPDAASPFHIAVLHTNVDGQPGHDNYAPARLSELMTAGFDYWALGHVHTRVVLAENPWVVYPGNVQGRHINEPGIKGAYLVDVHDPDQVRLTFRRSSVVVFERLTLDASRVEDEAALAELVGDVLQGVDLDLPAIIRLEVSRPNARLRQELMTVEARQEFLNQWRPDLRQPHWILPAEIVWVDAPHQAGKFAASRDFWGEVERQLAELTEDPAAMAALLRPVFQKNTHRGLKLALLESQNMAAMASFAKQSLAAWTEGEDQDGD